MTMEQRMAINERIDKMIGTQAQQRERVKHMGLSERITDNAQYQKMREKLFKIAENHGERGLSMTIIQDGNNANGVTVEGKRFSWNGNNGCSVRSRYCGSLWVEGIGTVFTSGTIAKAMEYILAN